MSTKIVAARLATSAGVTTVITKSSKPGNVLQIVRYLQATRAAAASLNLEGSGEESLSKSTASLALDAMEQPPLHTRFLPYDHPVRDRNFWLLHGLAPHGTIYVDQGAHQALADKAGLLPVGVLDVEGSFGQQEAVRIVVVERRTEPGPDGRMWEGTPVEVGRALVNYAAPEIIRIKGIQSSEIGNLLGYADTQYVAHRENISLFLRESRPVTPTLEVASAAAIGSPAHP